MNREASSFRDNSGFVFYDDRGENVYRAVSTTYQSHYEMLLSSGLYGKLTDKGMLLPHEETESSTDLPEGTQETNTLGMDIFKILKPEKIRFISYPYEWSFSQLKDAALLTLQIAKESFQHGMILKDASAYNIQFVRSRPVLIDTLSFEKYQENTPWIAYHQFCKHFLAPLAVMAHVDISLGKLLGSYIDGVPLDVASRLLPMRTYFSSLFLHVHLHARQQTKYKDSGALPESERKKSRISRNGFLGILSSLEGCIERLHPACSHTEWGAYYSITNYSDVSSEHKVSLVERYIERANPSFLLDIGANSGPFSRIASRKGIFTVSADIDPLAVDANYRKGKADGEGSLLPLMLDITNPAPSIGWANEERSSFFSRVPDDCTIMALALVHHLAISNNLPLEKIAGFFHKKARYLVIEFVPKSDSQVQKLLATRKDIFDSYTLTSFEEVFSRYFMILEKEEIKDSKRVMYLMSRKAA
jgi:hypothetical protein